MIEGQSCGKCIHFYAKGKDGEGQCRRDPPSVVVIQGEAEMPVMSSVNKGVVQQRRIKTNQIKAMFPPMLAIDPGCGEFDDGKSQGDVMRAV